MQYRLKQRHQIRYLVAFIRKPGFPSPLVYRKESLPSSHVHYIKAGSVDHAQSLCGPARHFRNQSSLPSAPNSPPILTP